MLLCFNGVVAAVAVCHRLARLPLHCRGGYLLRGQVCIILWRKGLRIGYTPPLPIPVRGYRLLNGLFGYSVRCMSLLRTTARAHRTSGVRTPARKSGLRENKASRRRSSRWRTCLQLRTHLSIGNRVIRISS